MFLGLFAGLALQANYAPVITQGAGPLTLTIDQNSSRASWTTWDRRFGAFENDVFNDAVSTPDGGYLLIGKSNSPIHGDKTQPIRGSYDYWLVKVDPNGNKTWDKRYGGESNDEAHGVVTAPDSGYLILGTTNSSADGDMTQTSRGQSDYWAIKLDADGNKTWDKRYGGSLDETAASLVAASDGGYLMFGNSNSQAGGDKSDAPLGQQDYWAVKIDGNGNKVWDKTYGGTSGDYAYSALATDDGGFLLLGYSSSGAGGNKTDPGAGDKDFWAVRINAAGNVIWDKAYGGTGADEPRSALATPDGGFLLVGFSNSSPSGNKSSAPIGGSDVWVVKINADGNVIWDETYGGTGFDEGYGAALAPDGGYLITGWSGSPPDGNKTQSHLGGNDVWTIRIDAQGNKVWDKRFGGSATDLGKVALPTNDGGFFLAGYSGSSADGDKTQPSWGSTDFWTFKINPDGNKTQALSATDADGNALSWSVVTPASNGTASVSGSGPSPTIFSYHPNPGFHGVDSFTVRVQDPAPWLFDDIEVRVLVRRASPKPLTNANFQSAVDMWFADEANATANYGHIKDWNVTGVTDMSNAFKNRTTFNENISGWDVSNVGTMKDMFLGSTAFNQPIGDWNVSAVTTMQNMFYNAPLFNQPIGNWNISEVLSMQGMFYKAAAFNQPIGDWNTSKVTSLQSMFWAADAFDRPIGNWDTSKVLSMQSMFQGADAFNQHIGDWNTSGVTTMYRMFNFATAFNRPIGNWNVKNVSTMAEMFYGATAFDQDVRNWNVSSVTTVKSMFQGATAFNQPIGDWNVSAVTTMQNMFYNAPLFNQPIGNWNISEVLSMQGMFYKAAAFNQPIGDWNTSKVTSLQSMFWAADAFDRPIGNWDTSKVLSMQSMFQGADAFNQHIGDWNTSGVTTMNRMFNFATAFNQPIGNWNVKNVSNMAEMFDDTPALSNANKGLIHSSFSSNPNWPYSSWSAHVPAPASLTNANFQTAINLWFSDEANANATYGHIRDWNVSAVTDMSNAFMNRTTFDENISGWDVSNVTNMSAMFYNAQSFNQPIGDWNVSAVADMNVMFNEAASFNQPLGGWNTSSVTKMDYMFRQASSFDQPLGDWNTSSVTKMQNMFSGAASFNGLIGTWNVSAVTDMSAMFSHADSFNQPIGGWDVSAVTSMQAIFHGAASFNQDIGDWNTSSVAAMNRSFASALSFDQDVGNWNVSAVTNMVAMFDDTPALSDANKGLIHASFKNNPNWPYGWSAHVTTPPPNQAGDNNQINPPVDNGANQPVDQSQTTTTQPEPAFYRPLPRTLAYQDAGGGNYVLWAMIMTDGGSPVTQAGFELADNMLFRNATFVPAQITGGSPNFTASKVLEGGKRYYFRAMAFNAAGVTYGSPRRLETRDDGRHWWSQATLFPGGWRNSDWLGTFRPHESGWIYHLKLGWAYAAPDGASGLWLWKQEHGWLWSQPGAFPYLWRHRTSSWHYLLGTSGGKPVFYDWTGGRP